MTDNPLRDNLIEVHSIGNSQIVLALSRDEQHALPMFCFTDSFRSHWLIELTAADLVRVFAQIENLLTADESDVAGWVSQLRGEHQSDNTPQEGTVMRFISNELPVPDGPDEPLVPLAELAVEFANGDVNKLASRIGSDAVVLDDIGRRCVSRPTARRLFTERAEQAAKLASRRAQWRKSYAELDARIRAERRGGIPTTSGSTALADMLAIDQR